MGDLSNIAEEAAGKAIDGILSKADSPAKTQGILLILGAIFMFSLGSAWFLCIAKPQADAQVETIRATNETNKVNADTNKINAETAKATLEVQRQMSSAIESINRTEIEQNQVLTQIKDKVGKSGS